MFEAAKIVIQLDHEMQPIWSGDDVVGSITVSAERAITIHEVVPSLKANLTVKVFAIGSASETIHSRVCSLQFLSTVSTFASQSNRNAGSERVKRRKLSTIGNLFNYVRTLPLHGQHK
eukprot:TRINITY_DN12596_c0_g1_i2.p4 TRINITY_DN12596_c0_g1~~TRINITY_DN12596_c0_g1_i2.p4  ORF type:complete len:118 (+),score=9.50 TRINITY_DN12596_c0_g1_i2:2219-2572(+)